LREECRLRVFKKRELRRLFESKRDEVTGKWRRLHDKELYAVFSPSNIIRVQTKKTEVGKACSTYGEKRYDCRVWGRNLREEGHLERPRRRWEDDIKMCLREVGKGGVD
jgi:hypothetical protein